MPLFAFIRFPIGRRIGSRAFFGSVEALKIALLLENQREERAKFKKSEFSQKGTLCAV
jgi:hypothetical protein